MRNPNLKKSKILKMFNVVGTKAPEKVPSLEDDASGFFPWFGSTFGSIPVVLRTGEGAGGGEFGILDPLHHAAGTSDFTTFLRK
jgi:hypothetical protein